MTLATIVLSALIVFPGLYALFLPDELRASIGKLASIRGRLLAAAFRLTLGLVLWVVYPETAHPVLFKVFAVVFIVSAVLVLLIGQRVFDRMIHWVASWPSGSLRAWGVVAIGLGVWLILML